MSSGSGSRMGQAARLPMSPASHPIRLPGCDGTEPDWTAGKRTSTGTSSVARYEISSPKRSKGRSRLLDSRAAGSRQLITHYACARNPNIGTMFT